MRSTLFHLKVTRVRFNYPLTNIMSVQLQQRSIEKNVHSTKIVSAVMLAQRELIKVKI